MTVGTTTLVRPAPTSTSVAAGGAPQGDRMTVALRRPDVVLLLVTFVVLGSALSAQVSAMPLFVTQGPGLDVEWSGVALGTCAALEIPVLVALGLALLVVGYWRRVRSATSRSRST